MSKTILAGTLGSAFLSAISFAGSVQVTGKALCFGSFNHGTHGEHLSCLSAANEISKQSIPGLAYSAECTEIKDDDAKQLESGCDSARWMVGVKIVVDTALVSEVARRSVGTCFRAGYVDGKEWKNTCEDGSAELARAAKACAIERVTEICHQKGAANCSDPKITYRYGVASAKPACVVSAVLSGSAPSQIRD